MKTLTHGQLVALLSGLHSGIVRVYADTTPELKPGCPLTNVTQHSVFSVFVGTRYKENVSNLSGRHFEAVKRRWGQVMQGTRGRVVEHKGKLYLVARSTPRARARSSAFTSYSGNGAPLVASAVRPWLVETFNKRQAAVGLDTVAKQVWQRDFSFASIRMIRAAGETYQITH